MPGILVRAGCFVAIIVMGFVLRRIGFFREGDFRVLSQITLKLTLPASIVVSFAQMTVDPAMLSIVLLAFGGGILYIGIAFLINLRSDKEQRAFDVLNIPGYNIGLFALPLVQNFVGPVGVVTTSLFDVGNAFVCLGGAYGVASSVKDGCGFSFKRIGKALLTSVPFLSYIIMITLNLTGIHLPGGVLSFADIIKNANTFMAMLMIGVGFKLEADRKQLWQILKIVLIRYSVAAALATVFYFLLPFSLEIRQTLVLLAFSPISSAVPAFTGEMKGDIGLSSAVNSICILCSIVIMTTLMAVML
jgi:predicted permease